MTFVAAFFDRFLASLIHLRLNNLEKDLFLHLVREILLHKIIAFDRVK